jgi:hypothetical protein
LVETQNQGYGLSVIWHQNHWDGFFGVTSKSMVTVFSDLTSKLVTTVSSSLASKHVVEGFPVWASKPAATIW